MPSWYATLRAADRCHCSVIELEKPSNRDWVYRALIAESAENEAREARDNHNKWRSEHGMDPI